MNDIGEKRDGEEEELRQVVLERVAAVQAKDPEPLAARQAPDVVTFDVLPPLHARGSEAVEGAMLLFGEETHRQSSARGRHVP